MFLGEERLEIVLLCSGEGEREAKMAALLADVEQLRTENAGNNATIATLTQKVSFFLLF